jgi:hypothetical protein
MSGSAGRLIMRSRQIRKEIKMDDDLAEVVKGIYSNYHSGIISAEEAMDYLEEAIAESNE